MRGRHGGTRDVGSAGSGGGSARSGGGSARIEDFAPDVPDDAGLASVGRYVDEDVDQDVDQDVEQDVDQDVDLSDDPFDDNLAEQLAATAPRRLVTRSTLVLAGVLLATAGFSAGTQVQQRYGGTSGSQGNAAPFVMPTGQRQAGQTPNAGQNAGAGNASGNAITGKIKLVDGTTIYIETSDGRVVTVKTSGNTTVQVAQTGTVKDLPAGASISVEGQTGSDGTVTASKVTRTGS